MVGDGSGNDDFTLSGCALFTSGNLEVTGGLSATSGTQVIHPTIGTHVLFSDDGGANTSHYFRDDLTFERLTIDRPGEYVYLYCSGNSVARVTVNDLRIESGLLDGNLDLELGGDLLIDGDSSFLVDEIFLESDLDSFSGGNLLGSTLYVVGEVNLDQDLQVNSLVVSSGGNLSIMSTLLQTLEDLTINDGGALNLTHAADNLIVGDGSGSDDATFSGCVVLSAGNLEVSGDLNAASGTQVISPHIKTHVLFSDDGGSSAIHYFRDDLTFDQVTVNRPSEYTYFYYSGNSVAKVLIDRFTMIDGNLEGNLDLSFGSELNFPISSNFDVDEVYFESASAGLTFTDNLYFNSTIYINSDHTFTGNLELNTLVVNAGANLELGGHRLMTYNDMTVSNGAAFNMNDANDLLVIGDGLSGSDLLYLYGEGTWTAGRIEIKGGDIYATQSTVNIQASGTHVVALLPYNGNTGDNYFYVDGTVKLATWEIDTAGYANLNYNSSATTVLEVADLNVISGNLQGSVDLLITDSITIPAGADWAMTETYLGSASPTWNLPSNFYLDTTLVINDLHTKNTDFNLKSLTVVSGGNLEMADHTLSVNGSITVSAGGNLSMRDENAAISLGNSTQSSSMTINGTVAFDAGSLDSYGSYYNHTAQAPVVSGEDFAMTFNADPSTSVVYIWANEGDVYGDLLIDTQEDITYFYNEMGTFRNVDVLSGNVANWSSSIFGLSGNLMINEDSSFLMPYVELTGESDHEFSEDVFINTELRTIGDVSFGSNLYARRLQVYGGNSVDINGKDITLESLDVDTEAIFTMDDSTDNLIVNGWAYFQGNDPPPVYSGHFW